MSTDSDPPHGVERSGTPAAHRGHRLDAPVRGVTLLEDRAQVTRQGTVRVRAGQNRIVAPGHRARAPGRLPARRGALAAPRGWRTPASAGPFASAPRTSPRQPALLEERLRALQRECEQVLEDQVRARLRFERISNMLELGAAKSPGRRLGHGHGGPVAGHRSSRCSAGPASCARRRSRPPSRWSGCRRSCHGGAPAAGDGPRGPPGGVLAGGGRAGHADGEVEVRIDYVVPNALWRPLHTARLVEAEPVQLHRVRGGVAGHGRGLEGRGAAVLHGALLAGNRAAAAGRRPAHGEEEERDGGGAGPAGGRCRRPAWAARPRWAPRRPPWTCPAWTMAARRAT